MAAQSSTRSRTSLAATGVALLCIVLLWGRFQPVEPTGKTTVQTCDPAQDSRCREVTLLLLWHLPPEPKIMGVSAYGYQLGNRKFDVTDRSITGDLEGNPAIHGTARTGDVLRIYGKVPRTAGGKPMIGHESFLHCRIQVNGRLLAEDDASYANRGTNADVDCKAIMP